MERMHIARLERAGLKQIVLDLVDGRILTSDQVSPDMVGMVFMPLMFGALSIPDGLTPPRPEEPTPEPLPPAPAKPEYPPAPGRSSPPTPPPYPTEKMDLVRWGRLPEEDVLPPYAEAMAEHARTLAEWEATNTPLWDAAMAQHKQDCNAITAEADRVRVEHQEACDAIAARNGEASMQYRTKFREWDVVAKEAYREWTADVGVIYEHYAKAGSRGINGYPMFMSCLILHREDWKIIREAADREVERRKNEDILSGL